MEKYYIATLGWYYRPEDVDRLIKELEADLEAARKERREDQGKVIKLTNELLTLHAENQRMIDIAGEVIGTQPEQRGPDTVEVLANHAKRLSEEIVRLRSHGVS